MQLKEIVTILKNKEALMCVMHYQNGIWQEHSGLFETIHLTSLQSPQEATEHSITFLEKDKYLPQIKASNAKAILVRECHLNAIPHSAFALVCENPYLAMAYLTEYFATPLFSATVPPKIHPSAQIGANVNIGNGSEIGPNCVLLANVNVGENVKIGADCVLFPGVCLYNGTQLGKRVRIHANSVIGSDGFGYAHTENGEHIKIYHNGIAILEDDVEVGANSTIDRAVFGETRIKKGVKIDNLVQIGHNCSIGEYSIIVAQTGISGSTTTGRNVVLGGQCGSAGHLHIGDFTQVGAKAAISKSLPANGKFSGHPILPLQDWLKLQALLKKLLKKSCNE